MIKNIYYPLLIDGGLSNELEKHGHNLNHKLWSAKLLDSNPEAIIQAHLAYLEAGARCITTSSYQASIPGFVDLGYNRVEAGNLIEKSVHLAEQAIKHYSSSMNKNSKQLIALSIGPYGAYLSDGSEYRGNYGISDNELREFHLPRIGILDSTEADFFACETIPSFQEAKVLSEILEDTIKPAWISFSCRDEHHLNDGTKIETCVEFLSKHKNIFAIGVNCTAPKYISGLIKSIKPVIGNKKIVVYPNSGEVYHSGSKTWFGVSDPNSFVKITKEWMEMGAEIVGGCCRIGTEHIKNINENLMN